MDTGSEIDTSLGAIRIIGPNHMLAISVRTIMRRFPVSGLENDITVFLMKIELCLMSVSAVNFDKNPQP
jgi:hypothetical protein